MSDEVMRDHALKELEGVGDEALGQWEERGDVAYHVRRRLTVEEEATIGAACDIRGTPEAQERVSRAWAWLQPSLRRFASEEVAAPA